MENVYKKWLWEKKADKCIKNLTKHKFDAHYVESSIEAGKLILGMTDNFNTFGFGGSDTTNSLGIREELQAKGKTLFDHNDNSLSFEEKLECRLKQGTCDCFLLSANGISETGEIVNVDGVGNRTNAMSFGPSKVIIVAGINKLTPDLDSAIKRIREIAAPMRAKSLGMDTPCAETGTCIDCNSPMRICNITTILHRKPVFTDISVILINEELGY